MDCGSWREFGSLVRQFGAEQFEERTVCPQVSQISLDLRGGHWASRRGQGMSLHELLSAAGSPSHS